MGQGTLGPAEVAQQGRPPQGTPGACGHCGVWLAAGLCALWVGSGAGPSLHGVWVGGRILKAGQPGLCAGGPCLEGE